MKYIKALGLALMAAMAVMAFFGASSASATVLCKVTPTGSPPKCPESQTYGPHTTIEGTAVNARLTPNGLFPDVICSHSVTTATTTNTGGPEETVTGHITNLEFNGCKTSLGGGCTVEVNNLPYHAEVHWVSGHNGSLTVTEGEGGGNPGATVTCAGVLECAFDNTTFNLPITGGNPATVTANGVKLNIAGGALCPTEAEWDASYKAVGENTAIWVAKEEEPG